MKSKNKETLTIYLSGLNNFHRWGQYVEKEKFLTPALEKKRVKYGDVAE
jgi:hypothetical protein